MEDLENFVFANVKFEVTEKQFVLHVNENVPSEALRKIKEEYEKDADEEEAGKIASMYLKNIHKLLQPDDNALWQPWETGLGLILHDDTLSGLAPNQHVVLYAADYVGTYKFVSPELLSNKKYLTTFVGLLKAMVEITKQTENGFDFGDKCNEEKGKVVKRWLTGDAECDAESEEYECGGVYHNNYMDEIGSRDHDCFWDCSSCKKHQIDKLNGTK